MAVRRDSLDRLEGEERDRAVRTPVHERVVVRVSVQALAADVRLGDRELRDPARRKVDLDDAAAHGRGC
jgi:hypothetical protein